MSPLRHHLATMAYNNAWANHRLLGALERLSHEAFAAPRVSFFGSIRATSNHVVTVDWFYVGAIERGLKGLPPSPDARRFFDPMEPFEDVQSLGVAQRAVDRRLVGLCVACNDGDLARSIAVTWRTGIAYEPMQRLLAHLFEHQIHHRGQIHGLLSQTALAPPQLDEFFRATEAPLRAAELAELGWSEAEIWDGSGLG